MPSSADLPSVVVGAGPAGLAAATRLAEAGRSVVVLEAAPTVGGRAKQIEVDGFRFDVGSEFFTDLYPETRRLIESVGLDDAVVEIEGPGATFHQGELFPMVTGPASALTTPLLSLRTKWGLRRLASDLLASLARLDPFDPTTLAPLDDRSALDYGLDVLGDEFTRVCLEPGLEALLLAPAAETSRALFLAQAQHGPRTRFFGLVGGLGRLLERLAEPLDVRLDAPVERLSRDGDAYLVEAAGTTVPAREVVVAIPAPPAARLLADLEPETTRWLERVRYEPIVKLHLGLEMPLDLPFPGVVPVGEPFEAIAGLQRLGFKETEQVPDDRDGLGVVARGELAERLLAVDDEAAIKVLEERARRILPDLPSVLCRRLTRLPLGMPHFPAGRFRDLVAGVPIPGSGVGIAGDYLAGPGLEGAIRSGLQAAEDLAKAE